MTTTTEFEAVDLTGAAPDGICEACAKSGVIHGPTQTTIAYCGHRLRGAYRANGGPWKVIAGIERRHFRDVVTRAVTKAELLIEVAQGLSHALDQRETRH